MTCRDEQCFLRSRAEEIAQMIEDEAPRDATTDELGHFWLHLTEASTLRLVRLRPEMVKRADER